MDLQLKLSHNQITYLTKDEHWEKYHDIIDTIVNSRYHTAFIIDPPIHVDALRQFWANAKASMVNGEVVALKSKVNGKVLAITPEVLSQALELNDNNAPTSISTGVVHATLTAYEYQGNLSHATIYKKYFDPQYKLLFHYLLMCLSPKTAGWDQMPSDLQQIFHSIVANQPFRASTYLFNELVINHIKKSLSF